MRQQNRESLQHLEKRLASKEKIMPPFVLLPHQVRQWEICPACGSQVVKWSDEAQCISCSRDNFEMTVIYLEQEKKTELTG